MRSRIKGTGRKKIIEIITEKELEELEIKRVN